MNCRRTRSLLSAYIDSELTGQEMLLIRDHLSWCEDCSNERESLLQVKRLLSALPEHAPRPSLVCDLQELASRHPIEITAIRFFRSLTKPVDAASGFTAGLSTYGRRFALAGVVGLMSVWFIVAPAGQSTTAELASTGSIPKFEAPKMRSLLEHYDTAAFNRILGVPQFDNFAQEPQMQNANLSLGVSQQPQERSLPVIGAPPFGQNVFLGGYPSTQSTSIGSLVYTGYPGSH